MQSEAGTGGRGGRSLSWIAAAGIASAAALVRSAVDLATPLVPKVNGAYYLVQVRSLLETGRLAFADFPLVFALEAGLAALLAALGIAVDAAIVAAVKAVDIVLPALAALPLFSLSMRLSGQGNSRRWPAAIAGIFGVLSWSPVLMTGDFQKNAVGMLAMAGAIASGHGAMSRGGAWRWIATAAFLAMAGLSHAGAFAVAISFAVLAGCITVAVSRPGRWKTILSGAGMVACATAILGVVLWATDRARFARMAGVILDPLSLFRRPILLSAFDGPTGLLDLVNALLVSAMSALGLAMLVKRWRAASGADRAVIGAACGLGLLLASPLIGAAWAERLSLMAYIPGTVALAYALHHLRKSATAKAAAAVVCVACALGLAVCVRVLGMPSIPVESVRELESLRRLVPDPGRTLVIARHGLEWWAAWVLRVRVAQEYDLDPAVWGEYAEVFMLRQQPPDRPPSPGGPSGAGARPFSEVRLPDDAEIVHDGRFFQLARAPTPPPFYPLTRPEARP